MERKNIRKETLLRFACIVLTIPICIIFFHKPGALKYISVSAILFITFQLIQLVLKSQMLIDNLFPPKTKKETIPNKTSSILKGIAMPLFLAGLVSFIFQITAISNTIEGTKFFLNSAGIGILFFILVIVFIKLKSPSAFDKSNRRFTIYFGYFLGLFFIFPATACYINTTYADKEITNKEFLVTRKSTSSRTYPEHYIFCKINKDTERFTVMPSFWDSVQENKPIVFCLKKGYFGYDFVADFKIPH